MLNASSNSPTDIGALLSIDTKITKKDTAPNSKKPATGNAQAAAKKTNVVKPGETLENDTSFATDIQTAYDLAITVVNLPEEQQHVTVDKSKKKPAAEALEIKGV